jgi:RNA polymerase sigma-70 factor (sigma-E family)
MDRLSGPLPRATTVGSADCAEAAVEVLFRRHYPSLLRTAYALLGSREGAEDAVQDAFVSLYRHWRGLRDPGAAEAYVRSAVLNRCRSWIRARVRDSQRSISDPIPLHIAGSDEVMGTKEDTELVAHALRGLPRRQREVVSCRYLLELTVAETAETLGITDGAVKQHAHRGLRALHTALEVAP